MSPRYSAYFLSSIKSPLVYIMFCFVVLILQVTSRTLGRNICIPRVIDLCNLPLHQTVLTLLSNTKSLLFCFKSKNEFIFNSLLFCFKTKNEFILEIDKVGHLKKNVSLVENEIILHESCSTQSDEQKIIDEMLQSSLKTNFEAIFQQEYFSLQAVKD